MGLRKLTAAALTIFVYGFYAGAQVPPEAILQVRNFTDIKVSPSGKEVAYVLLGPIKGTSRSRNIYIADLETRASKPIANENSTTVSPQWVPSGALYFILREEKTVKLMRRLAGTEALEVVIPDASAIESYQVSPDEKFLAYTQRTPSKSSSDEIVVDLEPRSQLWALEIATLHRWPITSESWHTKSFKWIWHNESKKNYLAVLGQNKFGKGQFVDKLFLSSQDGTQQALLLNPHTPIQMIDVTPDGKKITFLTSPKPAPKPFDLLQIDIASRKVENLTRKRDRLVQSYQHLPGVGIALVLMEGFGTSLEIIPAEGYGKGSEKINLGDLTVYGQMSYGGGTLAFDATRGLYPPEVFARTAAGEIVQLTDHNQVWKQIKLPRAEVKSIKTKSGADYEGLLIYPENYKPGVPHPMVTFVHGGPADRFTHYADSRGWATQLAAAGFVVFCPNQRGSTVATFQSMMSIKRDWGGQDLQDILAGVEQLVAAKIADKEKLAIVGWSYGGYMVQMAVGKTNMFKTAVSGAGMGDVALEYMIEDDLGRAMDTTFNGHPLKNPHVYKKISPTTYAKNVKTPILLIQGAADDIDPLAQTQVYYFYLKYYGAPVQLVVYPGEGHRFARDVHITDVFRRMAEWIEAGFSEPKPCESLLNKVISNR